MNTERGFDSPSVFAAILDAERGARYRLRREAIERLRPHLEADASILLRGAENERLTALTLPERPGRRSRAHFIGNHFNAASPLAAGLTTVAFSVGSFLEEVTEL